jgi:hypothetical protein
MQFEDEAKRILQAQPGQKKGPLAAKDHLEAQKTARTRFEAENLTIEESAFVSREILWSLIAILSLSLLL